MDPGRLDGGRLSRDLADRAAHGIIEAQRVLGQHGVVAKVNRECPTWFTVAEWRGHDTGWVRLGTMVRNRTGEYERLRVN